MSNLQKKSLEIFEIEVCSDFHQTVKSKRITKHMKLKLQVFKRQLINQRNCIETKDFIPFQYYFNNTEYKPTD
jgi:hypothetical protein